MPSHTCTHLAISRIRTRINLVTHEADGIPQQCCRLPHLPEVLNKELLGAPVAAGAKRSEVLVLVARRMILHRAGLLYLLVVIAQLVGSKAAYIILEAIQLGPGFDIRIRADHLLLSPVSLETAKALIKY